MCHQTVVRIKINCVYHAGLAAAVAVGQCAVQLDFFPTASNIGADVAAPVDVGNGTLIEKPCSGPSVSCAFPSTWLKTQQSAAFTALPGQSLSAGPLKIAVKEYTPFQPVIYFVPSSPLLHEGSDVSECVSAELAAATKRRSLQQSSPRFTVSKAASWTYSIKYKDDMAIKGNVVGNAGLVTIPANSQVGGCIISWIHDTTQVFCVREVSSMVVWKLQQEATCAAAGFGCQD
jgi:hypothetical protein